MKKIAPLALAIGLVWPHVADAQSCRWCPKIASAVKIYTLKKERKDDGRTVITGIENMEFKAHVPDVGLISDTVKVQLLTMKPGTARKYDSHDYHYFLCDFHHKVEKSLRGKDPNDLSGAIAQAKKELADELTATWLAILTPKIGEERTAAIRKEMPADLAKLWESQQVEAAASVFKDAWTRAARLEPGLARPASFEFSKAADLARRAKETTGAQEASQRSWEAEWARLRGMWERARPLEGLVRLCEWPGCKEGTGPRIHKSDYRDTQVLHYHCPWHHDARQEKDRLDDTINVGLLAGLIVMASIVGFVVCRIAEK